MSNSSSANDSGLRRSPELLSRFRSHLLIVDVQEKLVPVIQDAEAMISGCTYLMQTAEATGVPICVSEQYPKGLGSSVDAVLQNTAQEHVVEKLRFSASEAFLQYCASRYPDSDSRQQERDQVVIAGIEAHICVLQTAFDLLAHGLRVCVVEDAVGSRRQSDASAAMRRIRDAGAVVLTAESAAFEWCETAGTEIFRQVSRLTQHRDAART